MNARGADCLAPSTHRIGPLIDAACAAIAANAASLDELDAAIGDGDHGTNMARGARAIEANRSALGRLPLAKALAAAGDHLIMSVGGAAGPLYGTLLIELGRDLPDNATRQEFASALNRAVDAVARRGRSQRGWKTMLDVLYPLSDAVLEGASAADISREAAGWVEATRDLLALRGRASFLGQRSIGHIDPGAASAALLIAAACAVLSDKTS